VAQLVVQKYGGSSVADVEKIRAVARKVKQRREAGWQVVVVVSAMGDTTDELLSLAKQVSPEPPRRELDMLLSCGERISMALLSMALHELAVPAISFTGSQSGIITDESHAQARIVEVRPQRLWEALNEGRVVIVAGYQGVSRSKEVTTLGRGGSDTTAVALAAALKADCEIYSDVDGIFSADPRVVPDAVKLDALSYDEMQALASSGAKVLNAQAVEFAKATGITIYAKTAHGAGTGTAISGRAGIGAVAGVTCDTSQLLLESNGPLTPILEALDGLKVRSRAAFDDGQRSLVLVPNEDVHGLGSLRKALPPAVTLQENVATVTVVGTGLASDTRVLRTTLAALPFRPGALISSALQLTCVVPTAEAESVTRLLHAALVTRAEQEK
jgi:aspartate kinase